MVYAFKDRNGVKTCAPCGRDEKGYCASSCTTQASCSDARCPFKNPQPTSPAELEERYGHLRLWS